MSYQAREDFPGHAGIALESYRSMDLNSLEEHEIERRRNGLRDLVVANPHDPMIMINFANAWGDQGDIHEGISLNLEIVERWPDNYRAWWTLGWLVSRHAWQVRGETMWSEVPQDARDTFKLMSFLSDQIIDKAIAMNDKHGDLWVMKLSGIGSNGGYSSELMATFEAAAAVAPTHEPVYATTLNFSQNKWGGNAAARRRVIELAGKNNPDAAWPRFMRQAHEADFMGLEGLADAVKDEFEVRRILENPLFWKLLFGLVVVVIILSVNISMRRARRSLKMESDDYVERRSADRGPVARRELTPEEMLEQVRRRNESPNRFLGQRQLLVGLAVIVVHRTHRFAFSINASGTQCCLENGMMQSRVICPRTVAHPFVPRGHSSGLIGHTPGRGRMCSMPTRQGFGLTRARKHFWLRHILTYSGSLSSFCKNSNAVSSVASKILCMTSTR